MPSRWTVAAALAVTARCWDELSLLQVQAKLHRQLDDEPTNAHDDLAKEPRKAPSSSPGTAGLAHLGPRRMDAKQGLLLQMSVEEHPGQKRSAEKAIEWVAQQTVYVHENASSDAKVTSRNDAGDIVRGIEEGEWIRLADKPGYILKHSALHKKQPAMLPANQTTLHAKEMSSNSSAHSWFASMTAAAQGFLQEARMRAKELAGTAAAHFGKTATSFSKSADNSVEAKTVSAAKAHNHRARVKDKQKEAKKQDEVEPKKQASKEEKEFEELGAKKLDKRRKPKKEIQRQPTEIVANQQNTPAFVKEAAFAQQGDNVKKYARETHKAHGGAPAHREARADTATEVTEEMLAISLIQAEKARPDLEAVRTFERTEQKLAADAFNEYLVTQPDLHLSNATDNVILSQREVRHLDEDSSSEAEEKHKTARPDKQHKKAKLSM